MCEDVVCVYALKIDDVGRSGSYSQDRRRYAECY